MTHAYETQQGPNEDAERPDEPLDEELSIYDDEGEEFLERSQRRVIQARKGRPERGWY